MFVRSTKSVLLALLLLSCSLLASAKSCQVCVDQTSVSSWNDGGSAYTLVQVSLKNTGTSPVTSVSLNVVGDFDNFWEMVVSGANYVLPAWRSHSAIAVGQSHQWGYVIRSSAVANIDVDSVVCEGSNSEPTLAPTLAPTTAPTDEPTRRPTNPPTDEPTRRPTNPPTTRPTNPPTDEPTRRPTNPPTTRPTNPPTTRPTNPPTTRPTNPPTTRPTNPPTTRPTTAPTTRPPTNPPSSGGRICPAGTVWAPAPGTTWQWQLTGTIDQTKDVQMYDIDLFDNSASVISSLHARGRVVICYFSTQYEDWRPDASKFTSSILGANLDDWPGERYVDIRSPVLRQIMTERLDLAVQKGCDGVEPDNVDSYANSNGLGLKAADQLDYNKFLAQEAHKRGLSIGLKNDLDQVNALVSYFDWALNEQCNEYGECSMLRPFTAAGKAVFGVEYEGSAGSVCPKMVTDRFSWLMKDLNLGASGTQCCTYASGGCAQAAYTCVSTQSRRSMYDDVELVAEVPELVEAETVEPVEIVEAAEAVDSSASVLSAVPVFVVAAALALAF